MLANRGYFVQWLAAHIWAPSFPAPHASMPSDIPVDRVLVWFIQSLGAWVFTLVSPVAIGVLLSLFLPGRHRVAKLGGVIWSLYLTPLYLLVFAASYGYYYLNPEQVQMTWPWAFTYPLWPRTPLGIHLGGAYGIWWAAGIAANPYNRVRGIRAFVQYGVLYAAAWAVITQVLLPLGPLNALL